MSNSPLGIYWSVGTFFPCDAMEVGEHETSHAILKTMRLIPDDARVLEGLARLHWRFKRVGDAYTFWSDAACAFPALPWNLLHNPAWAAAAAVPDAMPEDGL